MLLRLLEWVAFVLVFTLGFVLGSYIQHRQDQKRIREIGTALRDAALRSSLRRAYGSHIVKGFDDDDAV